MSLNVLARHRTSVLRQSLIDLEVLTALDIDHH